MIAGPDPLFRDCYLQWMAQLQRVEPSVRGPVARVARLRGFRGSRRPKLAPLFAARCRIRMAATADRSMHLQTAWPRLARRLICDTCGTCFLLRPGTRKSPADGHLPR